MKLYLFPSAFELLLSLNDASLDMNILLYATDILIRVWCKLIGIYVLEFVNEKGGVII